MARPFSPGSRRDRHFFLAVLLPACFALAACSEGGSGPDEASALLRVTAVDADRPASDLAPSGFDPADITSFRVRVLAGTREVIDSTFTRLGAIAREFEVEPNTYVVEIEAFQEGDVLLLQGVGEATVAAGDTVALTVDLDPEIGQVDLTIGGQTEAVVPTNGTAPVRVVVRNARGQTVSGADVAVAVDPAAAGSVTFPGGSRTGSDGAVEGTFVPAGGEFTGSLSAVVDGVPVSPDPEPTFSILSPVDPTRSTVTLTNTFQLPADGVATSEIRARIVDRDGNPVANVPVVIRSSRNGGAAGMIDTIRGGEARTSSSGEVVATLSTSSSTNLAGDATISVVADGKTLATTGTISFLSVVSATASSIQVVPQVVPADGSTTADITVEVVTVTGGPARNAMVVLETKDNSLFRIQPGSGRTDASGRFRSRISSSVETGTIIDVFADGLKTSATGFVLFN